MRSTTGNDGKWLENSLQGALKKYCQQYPAIYHRFYDTHSARNPLPTQPGDFLLVTEGRTYLLECKSTVISTNIKTLARRTPAQIGKHKLWLRAGGLSRYVYLDLLLDKLVLIDGRELVDNVSIITPLFTGKRKDMDDLVFSMLQNKPGS